jgi:hypothetical protein
MQVKVTSTVKHLATVVEVFGPDPPARVDMATACVTAHSINLAHLPHPGLLQQGSEAPAICAEQGMRAFLIRKADSDWAIITGVPQICCCCTIVTGAACIPALSPHAHRHCYSCLSPHGSSQIRCCAPRTLCATLSVCNDVCNAVCSRV